MKNKRGIRFSIKSQIICGSVLINILICLVMGITIYKYVLNSYIQNASANTLAISKVAANQINGNLLGLLNAGSDDSYANEVMLNDMQNVMDSVNINAIYTMAERDGSIVYLSEILEDVSQIGEAVPAEYADYVKSSMSGEGYVFEKILKNSSGTNYITAYAPIINNSEEVVGVLGVDYIVDDLMESLNMIVKVITGIGVVLVLISVFVTFIITSGITSGLSRVDKKVKDLVSNNGDLTQKIEIKGNNEVTDISDSINELLEYIRGVVSSIYKSSNDLSGSVDSALHNTLQANDQLDGISATMEQMSAAMEQTSASLQQVQSTTNNVRDQVQEMYNSVSVGTNYAKTMETRAQEMRLDAEVETKEAEEAAESMTMKLNDKIEKSKAVEGISGLTQTILEIADQTNLLSLNASIEAARAGEHGKGFAVVAAEISTLATNSAETAKQIQVISSEVIDNVRELAEESTNMVDFVMNKTVGGYKQLIDTGVQYQEDAKKISEMLLGVDQASNHIEKAMENMSNAINDVTVAVEESARGISDVAGSVADMSGNMKANKKVANNNADIAKQLDGEVNKFKF